MYTCVFTYVKKIQHENSIKNPHDLSLKTEVSIVVGLKSPALAQIFIES